MSFEVIPERKHQPNLENETNLSRRHFILGCFRRQKPIDGEQLDEVTSKIDTAISEQGSDTEVRAGEESNIDLSRRKFINRSTGALAASLMIEKTVDVAKQFVEYEGGINKAIQSLKRAGEGVVKGNLTEYVDQTRIETLSHEQLENTLLLTKQFFEKQYSIPILFEQDARIPGTTDVRLISRIHAIQMLQTVLNMYLPSVISDFEISHIRIRNNLSTLRGDRRVYAFVMMPERSMTLSMLDDWWQAIQYNHSERERAVFSNIHHELGHLFFDSKSRAEETPDPDVQALTQDWVSLNPGGINDYVGDAWESVDEKNHPGFFSPYGTSDASEDQATVFEGLMGGYISDEWLKKDPVLEKKVMRVKRDLLRRSHGLMNTAYFATLPSGPIFFDYDWLTHQRMIIRNKKEFFIKLDPLFTDVTDEEYESWQRYHYDALRSAKLDSGLSS